MTDIGGRVVLVNHRTEEMFGYAPGDLIGLEIELLIPERLRAEHPAHRAGYVADPRPREMGAGLELYGRRKDGGEFPVDISLSPTRVDGNELVIAIVRDVSERRAIELERLEVSREQVALRRVATLVAHGAPPEELFAVVAEEVGRLLYVDHAHLARYEPEDTVAILADWSRAGEPFPVGARWSLGGENLCTLVAQTGLPARIDSYAEASGELAVASAERGFRSGVGAPITVDDRLWGVIVAGSSLEQPLRPDAEARLVSFTELVATAIANAEYRTGLSRLVDEQAALGRVATLVALGAPPEELFAVVTEEAGRLLHVDHTHLGRYESDDTVAFLADWSSAGEPFPVGARWGLGGQNLCTLVAQTGRPARLDSYPDESALAVATAERGFRSGVGAPIIVESRLWGVMIAGSALEQPLPAGTEARLASFTELVAMAIANADSRADLAASRVRIVAAADETRRRIERDLHDGIQQRLVTMSYLLRTIQAKTPPELSELRAELSHLGKELARVEDDLREIAHGIHPAILAAGGLGPALRTLAQNPAIQVDLHGHPLEARFPQAVEVAAYYVASEGLTNATKHAQASVVRLDVEQAAGVLRLCVRDDGIGGADLARGSGLIGLKDRVEAIGGTLSVQSPHGAGTRLEAEFPLAD